MLHMWSYVTTNIQYISRKKYFLEITFKLYCTYLYEIPEM